MPGFNHDDWTEEETQIFAGIIDVAVPFSYDIDREIPTESNNDIVERLIENKSLNLVYGKKNSGKSLLLVDAALHFSEGTAWAGRTTRSCEVTYYAYEQPDHIQERIEATYYSKEILSDEWYLENLFLAKKPPDILDKHYINALKYKIGDDLDFKFTDTLNENSGVYFLPLIVRNNCPTSQKCSTIPEACA